LEGMSLACLMMVLHHASSTLGAGFSQRWLLSLLAHAAGHATGGRTNDLLLLELSGWTWTQPNTSGTAPSPRSCAAITVGNGHHLIIHGGRNNFVLDDMHVLDLLTRTWIDVSDADAHTCLRVWNRYRQQLARGEALVDLLTAAICCCASSSCQPVPRVDDCCHLFLNPLCICRCLQRACCRPHATVTCCTCTTTGCTYLEALTSWAPALCRCSRHTFRAQQWTGLGRCMRQLLEAAAWDQVATCQQSSYCAGCLGVLVVGIMLGVCSPPCA
jgi:hypothetical protein